MTVAQTARKQDIRVAVAEGNAVADLVEFISKIKLGPRMLFESIARVERFCLCKPFGVAEKRRRIDEKAL